MKALSFGQTGKYADSDYVSKRDEYCHLVAVQ